MRVFVTKWFDRFATAERISDEQLFDAIRRAESGLIDATLGGGLIKQRVGRANQGKSGGYRTIIVFKSPERAIFVFGFAKNEKPNIPAADLKALKDLADFYMAKNWKDFESMVNLKSLRELQNG